MTPTLVSGPTVRDIREPLGGGCLDESVGQLPLYEGVLQTVADRRRRAMRWARGLGRTGENLCQMWARGAEGMRIGVGPHRLWPGRESELDGVLETARTAERLGFDHLIAGSHVLAGDLGVTPDPLVLLSAIAGATERIRVVTSVLILPLYNPVVVAHQAATLDRLSRGRFTLGVGTGWDTAEFAAVGAPFDGRGKRMDEQLAVMRELWEDRADGMRLGVRPRTAGGPEVWIGGQSDAALRRALRYGDGWHGSAVDAAGLAALRERLATLGKDAGRDPGTLALTSGALLLPPGFPPAVDLPWRPLGGERATADSVRQELALLEEAGLSSCSLWLPVTTEALPDALAWVAEEVLARA